MDKEECLCGTGEISIHRYAWQEHLDQLQVTREYSANFKRLQFLFLPTVLKELLKTALA